MASTTPAADKLQSEYSKYRSSLKLAKLKVRNGTVRALRKSKPDNYIVFKKFRKIFAVPDGTGGTEAATAARAAGELVVDAIEESATKMRPRQLKKPNVIIIGKNAVISLRSIANHEKLIYNPKLEEESMFKHLEWVGQTKKIDYKKGILRAYASDDCDLKQTSKYTDVVFKSGKVVMSVIPAETALIQSIGDALTTNKTKRPSAEANVKYVASTGAGVASTWVATKHIRNRKPFILVA